MTIEALDHPVATDCPNCGAAVSGNFCHACGQETVLHPPSTREFVHEFIGHYVALEGKLWKSLGLLLFRPGRLTLEYINGRRVRYIQPLRLYLTLSVIFFALLQYGAHDRIRIGDGKAHTASAASKTAKAAAPGVRQDDADDDDPDERAAKAAAAASTAKPIPVKPAVTAASAKPAPVAELVHEDRPGEIHDGTVRLSEVVGRYSTHLGEKVDAFDKMSHEERGQVMSEAFYHYVPYAVFFMMPGFALYLKVLYLGSGRRFGEHLLFALHTNAFAYLAFALWLLVPGLPGAGLVRFGLWLWLVFYLPTAMRRVYGGSRFVTALRWMVLMFLHLLTMGFAVIGGVAFGVLH